jgi:hypothetical protein
MAIEIVNQPNLSNESQDRIGNERLLKALQYQSTSYRASSKRWALLRAIASGGEQAEAIKPSLLVNTDGKGDKIRRARADAAALVNKIGPIIARFTTQLFVDPPKVESNRPNQSTWLSQFVEEGARLEGDPDQRAGFREFLTNAMFTALTEGAAIAQVDTRTSGGSLNLAGQIQSGELQPYVVLLNRESMWDWDSDENGLKMAKLHSFKTYRERWDQSPMPEHVFTIYEKDDDGRVLASQYRVRRTRERMDETIPATPFITTADPKRISIEFTRLSNGQPFDKLEIFNRNGEYTFPIIVLNLPGFLCIGDQLLELQKEHFNNRSSQNWAMWRANWAMPFIKGGDTDPFKNPQTNAGDGYYLWFPGDSDYQVGQLGVTSPAIDAAARKEQAISQDIYETLQQMAYIASQSPAALQRSEESRIKDKELELILLTRHGEILRKFALDVVKAASIAANDPSEFTIDGFSKFQTNGLLTYIPAFQGILSINGVPSEEFKRLCLISLARLTGTTLDWTDEQIQAVLKDIESLPKEVVMKTLTMPEPPAMATPPGDESQPNQETSEVGMQ